MKNAPKKNGAPAGGGAGKVGFKPNTKQAAPGGYNSGGASDNLSGDSLSAANAGGYRSGPVAKRDLKK